MPVLSLALVLVAAVVHATWNILAKGVRGDGALFVWWYGLVSTLAFLPIGLVEPGALSHLGWALVGGAAISGLLHCGYAIALQRGYERAPLGVVYPVARGTGPLLTMIVAVAVLGEHLTGIAILGAALVLGGVALVATLGRPTSSGSDASDQSSVSQSVPHQHSAMAGVLWGSLVGAFIAGYTLWDDHSMTTLSLPPVMYFVMTTFVLTATLTPLAWKRRALVTTSWQLDRWRIVAVGALSPLAYVLVLFAMRSAPVALVAPLRESSIVVGAILAWAIYREDRLAPRLVGVAVVLAGIALISAGLVLSRPTE